MPFATTPDGTRLYFETHGIGALLLVADQASDHRELNGVRAGFAAHHRVTLPPPCSSTAARMRSTPAQMEGCWSKVFPGPNLK